MIKSKLTLSFLVLFLSTIFVGCDQQKNPPETYFKGGEQSPKTIEKVVTLQKSEISEQPIISESKKNKQEVIVNVTAENLPVENATVNLISGKGIKKQTDKNGVAKFYIKKDTHFILINAFSDDYAVETYSKRLEPSPEIFPIIIDIILKEKGVIITAILIDKPEKTKNFSAVIREADHQGLEKIFVMTTNIIKNKIVFPAIPSKFNELQVTVFGENIPQCFSEIFCTTDGKDKKVTIEIPMNVTLKGTILLPDGSPFTNKFFISVSEANRSEGKHRTGEIRRSPILPTQEGNYKFSQLAQGFFDLSFYHPDYKPFETNLCMIPPEVELNFSFSDFPILKLRGKVIHDFDKQPLEDIKVCAREWTSSPIYDTDSTDSEGYFSLEMKSKHSDGFFGEITIDEPGFGVIRKQIRASDKSSLIIISLMPAGHITGKITDTQGNLLPGLVVESDVIPRISYENLSCRSLPSDINGVYVISNVAAPLNYEVYISKSHSHNKPNYTIPRNTFTVKVEPGKMAVCDLVAKAKPVILIKARDEKNSPVLKYTLDYKAKAKSMWTEYVFNVNQSDDDWFLLSSSIDSAGTFSCSAYNIEKSLAVETNNIFFGGGTNFIVLKMQPSDVQLNLSGYLRGLNDLPAKDAQVIVSTKKKEHKKAYVDNTGYFKIEGLKVKKGEMLRVVMMDHSTSRSSFTNLLSGSENVELRFTKPREIIGQVFFDNLETPATNFTIKCENFYKKQGFSTTDGKFTFVYDTMSQHPRNSGEITVSAENYFSEKTKFKFQKKSVCDVGTIILKSGKTASLRGRLVNQFGKPIGKFIYLKYKDKKEKFHVYANLPYGVFVFKEVLPGQATISAKNSFGNSVSNSFEISEGDHLELPDLVLNYTNSAHVIMKFMLPNGNYVEKSRIINNNYYIDHSGELIRDIQTGSYSDWKIKYNDKIYVVGNFVVTETTDRLEVLVQEETE